MAIVLGSIEHLQHQIMVLKGANAVLSRENARLCKILYPFGVKDPWPRPVAYEPKHVNQFERVEEISERHAIENNSL